MLHFRARLEEVEAAAIYGSLSRPLLLLNTTPTTRRTRMGRAKHLPSKRAPCLG